MKHKTPKTSSIEKALEILMAFNPHNYEMGTMELSQKLNYHPATVNRILRILSQKEFLQQNDRTRKFKLGPEAFHMGRTIFQSISGNILNIALPYLGDLCEKIGETVVLEAVSGQHMIVAYIVQGTHALSIGPRIGDRLPAHAAAGTKAIIAFSDQKMIDRFLDNKLQYLTPNTITDPEALIFELKKIRQQGVGFCREEMADSINGVGAPIFNHENKPIAAVAVVGLAHRVRCDIKSPIVAEVKYAASKIAAQLFHPDSIAKKS
jgi:DNA-binding IclR family transcriptional regulator